MFTLLIDFLLKAQSLNCLRSEEKASGKCAADPDKAGSEPNASPPRVSSALLRIDPITIGVSRTQNRNLSVPDRPELHLCDYEETNLATET